MERGAEEFQARVGLAAVAEPADALLGALVDRLGCVAVWELVCGAGTAFPEPPPGVSTDVLARRTQRWRARARAVTVSELLDRTEAVAARVLVPGAPDWPSQLDDLGPARPRALWLRGNRDLRHAVLRSVAVVGSRAASDYGRTVATELGFALSERGWTVLSGGAFGVDGAAHHGALAAVATSGTQVPGSTVTVLPCGIDLDYPSGHQRLFARVAALGNLVTELPPGATPSRHGFLVRNRIIAALAPGVVVVEAGLRSGAMSTVRHARDLHRLVMAVPGPVTSALSAGCHTLLREEQAVCVTGVADVLEQVGPLLGEARPERGRSVVPVRELDPLSRQVLAAVPRGTVVGPATVAETVGCAMGSALAQLGVLAATGHVERASGGWRRVGG